MALVQRMFAVGIVLWWGYFFALARHAPPPTPSYFDFEGAFPWPDLVWLVPLLVTAARHNQRGTPQGPIWTAASGGALVFLGLLDLAYNLQHGLYTHNLLAGGLNAVVNLACLGFGLYSVRWALHR